MASGHSALADGGKIEGHGLVGACPSWGGERQGGDIPETGSPTAVVHQQVGDDLAALQIETVEVRQPLEVATLEHGTALARVVEAEHGG